MRKNHLNLEPQIKVGLNKLLKAKIIFRVRHSKWVYNIVPVRKKNGDIRICIVFRNLNKAFEKDNFPVLPMEQILEYVDGFELLSSLDGFSSYNQILVYPSDQLKTNLESNGSLMLIKKCHLV